MRGRQIRAALMLALPSVRLWCYLAGGALLVVLGAVPSAVETSRLARALGLLPEHAGHGAALVDVVGRIAFMVTGAAVLVAVLTLAVLDGLDELRRHNLDGGRTRAC
ncbi:hypothetical protein DEJ04_17470 [Curtobacterium sp. MCLR17_044]|nr:hypothetical protein DEJ04_17470 [Curtobacterium sp. MCLR17_044]